MPGAGVLCFVALTLSPINPSCVATGILRGNMVYGMAADVLTPSVTRSTTIAVFISNNRNHCLPHGKIQSSAIKKCRVMQIQSLFYKIHVKCNGQSIATRCTSCFMIRMHGIRFFLILANNSICRIYPFKLYMPQFEYANIKKIFEIFIWILDTWWVQQNRSLVKQLNNG